MHIKQHTTTRYHNPLKLYINIIFIKIMIACGGVLVLLTSLYNYYGSVLVACGSM